jgi:hypothetical protein
MLILGSYFGVGRFGLDIEAVGVDPARAAGDLEIPHVVSDGYEHFQSRVRRRETSAHGRPDHYQSVPRRIRFHRSHFEFGAPFFFHFAHNGPSGLCDRGRGRRGQQKDQSDS